MADQKKNEGEGGQGGLPKPAIVAIVIAVIVAAVFIVMGQRVKFEPVVAGKEALDFTLPDLDGKEVSLTDFRGKVVFLNFWATWCTPCEDEMPSMQALYDKLKGKPFEIVAVSVDKKGAETVRKFAEKYGLTFTILHDRRRRIKETYKTTGVPETFIIDQNGVVAEKVWGPRDWSSLANTLTIMNLLADGPKAPESYSKRRGSG
jgi:peroxiredoxin